MNRAKKRYIKRVMGIGFSRNEATKLRAFVNAVKISNVFCDENGRYVINAGEFMEDAERCGCADISMLLLARVGINLTIERREEAHDKSR